MLTKEAAGGASVPLLWMDARPPSKHPELYLPPLFCAFKLWSVVVEIEFYSIPTPDDKDGCR
jgi:hypothetical protein